MHAQGGEPGIDGSAPLAFARVESRDGDGEGRDWNGATVRVVEGLQEAQRRMKLARDCVSDLAADSHTQGPLVEAELLRRELASVQREKEELERIGVKDRQEVREMRHLVFALQASMARAGVENQRLESQLEDMQARYQTLVNISSHARLQSIQPAIRQANPEARHDQEHGALRESRFSILDAQAPEASKQASIAGAAAPLAAHESEGRTRETYEAMQKKVTLAQADAEHQVQKRVELACLLAKIVAQADPAASARQHGTEAGVPPEIGGVRFAEVTALAASYDGGVGAAHTDAVSGNGDGRGNEALCLERIQEIERAVLCMTPAQLASSLRLLRAALTDAVRCMCILS